MTRPCELFTTPWIPGDPTLLDENGQLRFPRGWAGQNNTGYSNPEFDAACLRARNSLPGSSNYVADHFLAQEIFARDLPVIPLFPRIKLTITRPDIAGYSLDVTGRSDFWSLEAIDRLGE